MTFKSKVILVSASTACLMTCGTSTAFAATTATAGTVVIEAYGDSTTEGWEQPAGTAGYVTRQNVPALLQARLQSLYGPTVTVIQQGVGGTEASQLLNGTDGVHTAT